MKRNRHFRRTGIRGALQNRRRYLPRLVGFVSFCAPQFTLSSAARFVYASLSRHPFLLCASTTPIAVVILAFEAAAASFSFFHEGKEQRSKGERAGVFLVLQSTRTETARRAAGLLPGDRSSSSVPIRRTMPGHRRLSWVVSELEEFNYEEVRGFPDRKHVMCIVESMY